MGGLPPNAFVGYLTGEGPLDIRPAPLERDWMDATSERYAYRCLPLNIANTYGWEILCPAAFTATWNGLTAIDAIAIKMDDDGSAPGMVTSHFGHGVLTFQVPCLFRTAPGFDLMVQGPINRPKDAIQGLTGVVETDWSPYTFTMNWRFTRADTAVRFDKGEPFCHVFPLRRRDIEDIEPTLRPLVDDPETKIQHDCWAASRVQFNRDLNQPGSIATVAGWQKRYHQGVDMEGRDIAPGHRTKVRVRRFTP